MDKYINLVSLGKDNYITALENIGWFNFSNSPKDKIIGELNKIEDNKRYVFCLYNLSFDAEGFEDDYSYKTLLEEIIKIIGLEDYKLNVEYSAKNNSVNIKIETKNNVYEYCVDLDETEDWIDGNVIDEYINNNLLKGENINKIFNSIPPEDQTVQFIYIQESIYERAIAVGIIPEDNGYFIE